MGAARAAGMCTTTTQGLHPWQPCQHELWSFLIAKGVCVRDEGVAGRQEAWGQERNHIKRVENGLEGVAQWVRCVGLDFKSHV